MLIYEGTKERFIQETMGGTIAATLLHKFKELGINGGGAAEIKSWENSLIRVAGALDDDAIPNDADVAIEYRIPTTAKRIDFMIAGKDSLGKENIYMLELKQWESAETSRFENCLKTYTGGAFRHVQHPAAQIYNYAMLIKNLNQDVCDGGINLIPAAYLHNYKEEYRSVLFDPRNSFYTDRVSMFLSKDYKGLRNHVKRYIVKRADRNLFDVIEHGRLKPSKALQDSILSLLEGNEEFFMLDEQQVAYSVIHDRVKVAARSGDKTVIIVQGGPGTGKSVIAVSLLANLISEGYSAAYVTKNAAPRAVFSQKLTEGHKKQAYIKNLFKSSQGFLNEQNNRYDCLLVDEAHRLGDRSNFFDKSGIDQARRIIHASRVSVFFTDEDQLITTKDIGTVDQIIRDAKEEGATVITSEDLILKSQFRCNGSDAFIAWVDNALGIRETANEQFDLDYDLRVYSDPCKMREDLRKLNSINNKARMLAGYTYEWVSQNEESKDAMDIVLPHGFEAQWNFANTIWAIDKESFDQVGCIYTSQGLEFDYIGVIFGLDMRYENGEVITDPTKNAGTDHSTFSPSSTKKGWSSKGDRIIRNTYKTLVTRGQKGCFIYCEDPKLAKHFICLGAKPY